MNRRSLWTGTLILVVVLVTFFRITSCGGSIDEAEADELKRQAVQSKAQADTAAAKYDSLLALIPTDAQVEARTDSIRAASQAAIASAVSRALRAREQASTTADDLVTALEAARMAVWVPHVRALEGAVDSVAVAKDEQREVEVAAEREISKSLGGDLEMARLTLAAASSALEQLQFAYLDMQTERDFWQATARELDGFKLFGINVGCTAGVGAAAGFGGAAAGVGATCGVRF